MASWTRLELENCHHYGNLIYLGHETALALTTLWGRSLVKRFSEQIKELEDLHELLFAFKLVLCLPYS